jgi:aldose 1-epimerase
MTNVVELRSGNASARLLPAAGGRVSSLRLCRKDGHLVDVLHPYPEDFFDPIRWAKGGIYPLIPYSNRIASAQLMVDGQTVALTPHPDSLPHSLHGNAHAQAWQIEHTDGARAVMTLDSPASAAWPWHYTARMTLELSPSALHITVELCNADTCVMPAGIGLHPYFRHAPSALVCYRATTVWPATREFLPGTPRPPRDDQSYAPARALPAGGLTDYVSGWDGTATVDLPANSPGNAQLLIKANATLGHLVVHRPDNLSYLCLEPVSHVADGFNLAAKGIANTGTRLLAPGESLSGSLNLSIQDP